MPNNEDLNLFYYKCPECGTKFNPFGHLRSFTLGKLRALFSGPRKGRMECLEAREIGPVPVRPQNVFLSRFRLEKFGHWSNNPEAVCPNCGCFGNSARLPLALRLYGFALRLANAVLNPRKIPRATWLLAVYRLERVKEGPFSRACAGFAPSFERASKGGTKPNGRTSFPAANPPGG